MNSAIRILTLFLYIGIANAAHAKTIEQFVKQAAIKNGLVPSEKLNPSFDPQLAKIGGIIFESKSLSLNGNMSCQTCHLDKFGSADGIPNAVGIGGEGEGAARILKGGDVVPRNTLPLWGRGVKGFRTFFWDGKVDFSGEFKISQFGSERPSDDPLILAIHLPVVEIREMLAEDKFVGSQKQEAVSSAKKIYEAVMARLQKDHPQEMKSLSEKRGKLRGAIEFGDVAFAIKNFFIQKFAIKPHRFERFVFGDGKLNKTELTGATLFYGKGKCVLCHSGPLFSDLDFHVIPFRQLGSGKNGFGVDYGRFNVTHNPADLYKFRTPPLLNCSKTAPYGHSGSIPTLLEAISLHFDPLRGLKTDNMSAHDRVELFKRIAASSQQLHTIPTLDETEINSLVAFLRTLDF
jgi:cytochrome c peroxidase